MSTLEKPSVAVPLTARLESTDFDTDALRIHRVVGDEAISQPFRFDIEAVLLDTTPLNRADLLGADASLVFEREGLAVRTLHGMIAKVVDLLDTEPGHRSYRIVLVPRLHRLALIETSTSCST